MHICIYNNLIACAISSDEPMDGTRRQSV